MLCLENNSILNSRKVGYRIADGVSEVPRHLGFNSLAGCLLELLGNTEEKTGLWPVAVSVVMPCTKAGHTLEYCGCLENDWGLVSWWWMTDPVDGGPFMHIIGDGYLRR
jgi:hypothetical protein